MLARLLCCALVIGASFAAAQTIRIDCGTNQAYTASDGAVWQADQYFTGGQQLYTGYPVANTPDSSLYRWARQGYYGDFSYNIPVANGNYQLTLKFAEIQYSSAGSRIFNVTINGAAVLTNFDIVAQAGAWKAIDKQFPVSVSNGTIQINVHGVKSVGLLSAIQIVPTASEPAPALQLSGSGLSFSAMAGGGDPAAQTIGISNSGGGTLNWSASKTQSWLTLSSTVGTAPATLSIGANLAGLAAGIYSDTVTVSAPGADGSPQTVNVTLTITAAPPSPALNVSSTAASFSATAGGSNPAAKNITVTNSGGGTLNWTASKTQSWLTLSAASGTAPSNLGLSASIAGLAAGTYTDTVTIAAAGATGSPQTVGVTLTVSPEGGATGSPSATYVRLDTTTQGNWKNKYGADGYNFQGAAPALPSYAQVSVSGASTFTWASSTADGRALQQANGLGRVAATWYASGTYSFDLNLTDGNTHQLALYAMDYDNSARSERVDIVDPVTGAVLDSRTMSGFSAGQYLVWNLSGHVTIQITQLAGPNAVTSGLFFDAPGQAPDGSTAFVRRDTSTQGNWKAVYGADGYDFASLPASLPSYVQVAVNGASNYTWAASTTDGRALQQPSGTGRFAATWYGSGSFSFDVRFTDSAMHQIALYAMDYDSSGRSERVDILDSTSGVVLDSQTLNAFTAGQYLVWNLAGHVTIRSTVLGGLNPVVSGLFFGGAPQQTLPPALNLATHTINFSGIAAGSNPAAQNVAITNSGSGVLNWTASKTQTWLTLSTASGTTPASLGLAVAPGSLSAGTYTDTITISAPGADSSPQTVAVTLMLTAPPVLGVAPESLSFSAMAGGANPPPQTLNILNSGDGALNWNASKSQPWLSLSAASGSGPAAIAVSVATAGLTAGTYTDSITINAPGAASSPRTVNVTFVVNAAIPTLTVSTNAVNFTATAGFTNPAPQSVTIANTGVGTLNWTASKTQSWLTLSATSGIAPSSLGLTVSSSGLSAGTYNDVVTIASGGANGSPQTIAVTLTLSAAAGNSAAFVRLDAGTQGNWKNTYGGEGYDFIGAPSLLPSYAQVAVNEAFIYTWAGTSSDIRALQQPTGSQRVAATWYAAGSLNFDLNFTDGLTHQLALYATDFDTSGRSQRIDIVDGTTSLVLDSRSMAAFAAGQYLVWNVSGHVVVRVVQTGPLNAIVSGLFLDAAGQSPVGSSLFASLDRSTQGNWTYSYGRDGYQFQGEAPALPPYAQISVTGASTFTWAGSTGDGRALQKADGLSRVAATWYSANVINFDINLNDSNLHQLALYAVDYDRSQRSERVELVDSATGVVLDSHTLSGFENGQYLVWNLTGHIVVRVTRLSGSNAVVSGLFFGGPPKQILPATLNLSTSIIGFAAIAGSGNPGVQSLTITNKGSGVLNWTAAKTQPWLTLSAASGTAPSTLALSAGAAGLAPGTYTDTVIVNAAGASGSPQSINVTLNVRSLSAALGLSQNGLTFSASTPGSNPAAQIINIANTGVGTLNWAAAKTQSWLTLSATSGTAPSSLSIGVNTAGLGAGIYTDTVVVTSAGAIGSPNGIAATLVIGAPAGQHYVSPQGSPTGDGTINSPWDLQTALYQPASVLPGDIIWIRGGVYGNGQGIFYSRLVGTSSSPIIVRQFPGERATINGWLQIGCCDRDPHPEQGAYVWFWGLEFASSVTDRTGLPSGQSAVLDAIDTFAPGSKLINNTVHDTRLGISMWKEAIGAEAYGNVIYFNGFQASDRGHGHGFYVQNETGTMNILNNIVFDQFDNGLQFYGSGAASEKNFLVQGNISFNNGSISTNSAMADDVIFVNTNGVSGVQLLNNYFYFNPQLGRGYNEMGWPGPNQDIVVKGNYFIGGFQPVVISDWASVVFQNNTVYTDEYLMAFATANPPTGYVWDSNNYYGNGIFSYNGSGTFLAGWQGWTGFDLHSTFSSHAPTGIWTFVQPNKYETGRANIAIYNWDLASTVSVNVPGAIAPGTRYQILDAQNYFGAPVAAGTYDGAPISIPMAGLTIATPNGSVPTQPTHTAPQFGAFVLIPLQ